MEWLLSIVYGLVSGLTQFLPVSSGAHGAIVLRIFGSQTGSGLLSLLTRLGCLLALLVCCRGQFAKLRRDRRPDRHRRSADKRAVFTMRLQRTALIPLIFCWLFYNRASALSGRLNLVAIFLVLNGVLLFLPQLFPSANKDARSVSRLDGVLLGLGAGASVIPGISHMGAVLSLGSLRGMSREFSLNFALLISVPVLILGILGDLLAIVAGGLSAFDAVLLVRCLLAGVMGFLGSCCGISIMRLLAVKVGYSAFAYYSWGAALFAFILFMTI